MKFKEVVDGVYYYDVCVSIKNKKSHVVLPRYHIFLGWIEIFGFPPQHEWVVLSDIKPFSKKAIISIDGKDISEQIDFNLNKKEGFHDILITRESDNEKEKFKWSEDYSKAPILIKDIGVFKHSGGIYEYTEDKVLIENIDSENLNDTQRKFIKDITDKYGKPSAIWLKSFKGGGNPPSIFYKIFPIHEIVDLSDVKGSIVELGYMSKGKEEIDRAHGNWHKLFDVNGKAFYIKEGDYKPATVEVNGILEHIKGEYNKKLYSL